FKTHNLTVNNNTFKNNKAGMYGGAIINEYGDMTISNNDFINNSAGYHGGAILDYIVWGETGTYTNYDYWGNPTGTSRKFEQVTITNNNFIDNHANYDGGAIYNYPQEYNYYCIITDNTFNNNTAERGSAIITTTYTNISNNIFTKNKAYNTSTDKVINDDNGDAVIKNNIKDDTSTYVNTITIFGDETYVTNNIFKDGKDNTKITISTNNSNPTVNDKIKLTFTLQDQSNKNIPNQTINIDISNKKINLTTNANGIATYDYTLISNLTQVTAIFSETDTYNESNTTLNIKAKKINTKLDVKVSNTTPQISSTVTFTATLVDINNKKLANQSIVFNIDNKNYTVKTNANGIATQSYKTTKVANMTITAKYSGTSSYNSSSSNVKINIKNKIKTMSSG
ncbi:MAG: hypothetical protein BZ136_08325, partial [Methanosphaera sp. rholeuAM74]